VIKTLVFEKDANFVRRKLAEIAENCDPNIDPWTAEINVIVSEIFSTKKLAKIGGFDSKIAASLCPELIMTLIFEENAIFH
jgi:hypothetical protein